MEHPTSFPPKKSVPKTFWNHYASFKQHLSTQQPLTASQALHSSGDIKYLLKVLTPQRWIAGKLEALAEY